MSQKWQVYTKTILLDCSEVRASIKEAIEHLVMREQFSLFSQFKMLLEDRYVKRLFMEQLELIIYARALTEAFGCSASFSQIQIDGTEKMFEVTTTNIDHHTEKILANLSGYKDFFLTNTMLQQANQHLLPTDNVMIKILNDRDVALLV